MTAVWSLQLPDSEKLVLLALADCANDEGYCWPSMATLATKCSKSDRTVQASIKALVNAGHLTRNEIVGKGCSYTVHPTPEAASPPKPLRPAKAAPPKPVRETPEAASDKPSLNHHASTEASPPTKPRAKSAPRVRMPADWKPVRFADGTVAREIIDRRGREWGQIALESFRNWAVNADDRVGRKSDWQAAWVNWIIEQDRRDGRRNPTHGMGRNQRTGVDDRTVNAAYEWAVGQ